SSGSAGVSGSGAPVRPNRSTMSSREANTEAGMSAADPESASKRAKSRREKLLAMPSPRFGCASERGDYTAGVTGSALVQLDDAQPAQPQEVRVERPDEGSGFGGQCADQQVAHSKPLASSGRAGDPLVHELPRLIRGIENG